MVTIGPPQGSPLGPSVPQDPEGHRKRPFGQTLQPVAPMGEPDPQFPVERLSSLPSLRPLTSVPAIWLFLTREAPIEKPFASRSSP